MKTLIFLLFPLFLSAQVIRDRNIEIPCPPCYKPMALLFRSSGGIDLVLCMDDGHPFVFHKNKLKPAKFLFRCDGIEIEFDNRKIFFTQNIAYEGSKKYICDTYGKLSL